RPRRRILGRHGVLQPVLADASEALAQVQVFARALAVPFGTEIRDVANQRLPFPASARVTVPEAEVRRSVLASVHRDDAHEPLPLSRVVIDADLAWRLHDLIDRPEIRQSA